MNYDLDELHSQIKLWHEDGQKVLYLIYFDGSVQFTTTMFGIYLATWDEWAIETGVQNKTILADWVNEAIQFYTDRKEQERLSER